MLSIAIKYFLFILKSHFHRGYIRHSSFVYDLHKRVFSDKKNDDFEVLLNWRKKILLDKRKMEICSFGAGSGIKTKRPQKVGNLVNKTAVPHKYGAILYNVVREFKPHSIIELGTGFGISTAYLAAALPGSSVQTIEGSPERSSIAKEFLHQINILNVTFITGEFENILENLLLKARHPLLLFIDGNHKYQPSLNYFQIILKYVNDDTIIIFDDIHWSSEMEKAWKEIYRNEKVILSLDLFRYGMAFFRKGMTKQHVLINF